jgi:hypothetical protein
MQELATVIADAMALSQSGNTQIVSKTAEVSQQITDSANSEAGEKLDDAAVQMIEI